MSTFDLGDDLLSEHLREVPPFRALLRATECRLIREAGGLTPPVIDLGCGDGHFAWLAFDPPLPIGLDPDIGSLRESKRRNCQRDHVAAEGGALPFADESVNAIVANSVLEHIPILDRTLDEVYRVLRPQGRFVLTTPSDRFGKMLLMSTLLRSVGLKSASRKYGDWFNNHSRHYHTDGIEIWRDRLMARGFRIEVSHEYFSASAHRVFDILHYLSLPNLLTRKLTGRWVLFHDSFVQHLWHRWLSPYFNEDLPEKGAYLFIHAVKEDPTETEEATP
ncbi:MAG: class I SAM-dependent methyltransferase [Candidatus Omnitrophica bacterium]|nr:class I SAM-dependent methyltransferase [Candidatus Omnitrophota bacterium]